MIQGDSLGDRQAARRAWLKAAALLEPIAGSEAGGGRDQAALAEAWLRLAVLKVEPGDRTEFLARARSLIEQLPPYVRDDRVVLAVETLLWFHVGNERVAAKDFVGTKAAREQQLRAAAAAYRRAPDDVVMSRNLSLAYKQLGAVLEVLKTPEPAVRYYEEALALDKARVARDPANRGARLDLTFAIASLGDVRFAEGNFAAAREYYRQVLDIRRQIVADEPADEFSSGTLARAYRKMADVTARLGDAAGAIEWQVQRVGVHRDRLLRRPNRPDLWTEYEDAARQAIGASLDILEAPSTPRRLRAQVLPKVRLMLDGLASASAQRMRDRPPEEVSATRAALQSLTKRMRRLSGE
jgi:tetratricopeptide (TPR) repeat protein